MPVTVGFIGTGNMGGAIAIGLAGRNDVNLVGFDLDLAKMDNLRELAGMHPLSSAAEVAGASDYLILAVKPHYVENILATVAGELRESTCLVS
ncbi:MAG: pyrroline-5-carboxylate reductase family protein, partial [Desulfohalobiaceae bacterium]